MWSLANILGVATSVRLLLICYGRIQDYMLEVKFTDVDHHVFCDGAKYVHEGRSPYERATYRYSPILAYMLLPTVHMPEFGKLLFNAADLLVALFIYAIVRRDADVNPRGDRCSRRGDQAVLCTCVWLFNPVTAVVSSRGNAEALIAASVLATLYLLLCRRYILAAFVHGGLAITLKIYPIIYLPSAFVFLAKCDKGRRKERNVWGFLRPLIANFRGYTYCAVALGSFALTSALSYWKFGDSFLDEALLYHISRTDIRHNFSPYFYLLYLSDGQSWAKPVGLLAFLPQLLLMLIFALRYSQQDLPFTWFLTTFAFVSFNKVCTSQYFVWYLCLFPLIVPILIKSISIRKAAIMVLTWFSGQALWLLFAYLFEFQGWNTFILIWTSSLLFLAINCWLMAVVIEAWEKQNIRKDD